ncbi:MAG: hypothetical protein FWC92_08295 [Defluviitaleaceae bacterium]|nr:hypothetical protein [Defluviitaleaceae bacterium]
MMSDYQKYIDKYIDLLSQTCYRAEDYGKDSKISTRQHNNAMRKLITLRDVIDADHTLAEKVYSNLLKNDSMRVRHNAASACLNLNINVKESEEILEHISKTGHAMAAIGARRILKRWRGEIGPDDYS